MKRFFCITLLLLPFSLFSQYEIDGIGFVDLRINDKASMYELDLYTKPKGATAACLVHGNYRNYFRTTIADNQDNRVRVTRQNSKMIAIHWGKYYGQSLQYYEEKNGFVQVKINDTNYWINLDDLANAGGKTISWKDYFSDIDHNQMRVLYTMNLRTTPTANSDKMMVVRRIEERQGIHFVELTGNFEGNWAEVNIRIWQNSDYCENRNNSDRTVKGWMKYLDDKGFPNLFPIDFSCC